MMGHSFINYKEKKIRVNDKDLMTCCSVIFSKNKQHKFSVLDSVFDRWRFALNCSGTGAIDLDLDELINEERRRALLFLISESIEKVNEYDNFVPRDYLNAGSVGILEYNRDYRKDLLLQVLEEFKSLFLDETELG